MSDNAKRYKDTVNLPVTTFPMRASLTENEPKRLARWEEEGLYHRILEKRKEAGGKHFLLHDGPPFANGDVHMGTALNKLLKDLIIKARSMAGAYAPFVPGWDCHGLPIEFRVVKEARGLDAVEIRKRSEAYARKFIDVQRASFRRLGVFADWDKPYLTLDKAYEADVLRTFATLAEKDLVYQSRKPVLWSYGAGTALAEAEVEYKDKTSPAVFVAFRAESGVAADHGAEFVIWTTTPWTLPSNLAIALHPQLDYTIARFKNDERGDERTLVLATSLLERFEEQTGYKPVEGAEQTRMRGSELANGSARHPFLERLSKIITADFVSAESGTGQVHIAPGHGMDDYIAGQQNGLDILSPVDDGGRFTSEVGFAGLEGMLVFDSNGPIVSLLAEKGALLAKENHHHSYPHCWRSKTPIIFRAVEQFFIRIDGLRKRALEEIDKVEWLPAWGRNRIHATVETRPDWCISRQRTWGVPLPVFFTAEGEAMLDAALVRKVADIVEEQGSNAWFAMDDAWWADQLGLPEGSHRRGDTLDVWIDSGCSSMAVLDRHPDLHRPADIYIEATDQHRGWFQSSLMLSVATHDAAPYKKVITHGFVIDTSTGEKISKSGDKPINAEYYYNKYGADIVRLWAGSIDYKNEVPFSDELFTQVVETYRRIRNTLRVLLGNLHGFDFATDHVAADALPLADRWILERLHVLVADCREAYAQLDFRKVYNLLNAFCVHDLSAMYIDMTKDRLYCDAVDSPRRNATRTAMHHILEALCPLLAPILTYTADEAWEHFGKKESVHLETFPEPDPAFAADEASPVMDRLLALREELTKQLENARATKLIGKSLDAAVTATLGKEDMEMISGRLEETAEIFILSKLDIVAGDSAAFTVQRSNDPRCERCWRHLPDVGTIDAHPQLCTRCAAAIDKAAASIG